MNEFPSYAPDISPEKHKKKSEQQRFEPGMELKVQQKDGSIEPGWIVEMNTGEPADDPRIILLKVVDGVEQKRSIPTSVLIKTNSELPN
jgi:hypothetical protein